LYNCPKIFRGWGKIFIDALYVLLFINLEVII
jgi:hypothetical protein